LIGSIHFDRCAHERKGSRIQPDRSAVDADATPEAVDVKTIVLYFPDVGVKADSQIARDDNNACLAGGRRAGGGSRGDCPY
jgi:hypothetical protein